MSNLAELISQKAALEKRIAEVQSQEREAAIAQIRNLMELCSITSSDLGDGGTPGSSRKGIKVPVKYRDLTGNHWSGRGLQPKWLQKAIEQGRKLSDFAV